MGLSFRNFVKLDHVDYSFRQQAIMKTILTAALLALTAGLSGCSSISRNADPSNHASFWRDGHYFVWVEGQYVYRLLQWTWVPGHYQPQR